VLISRLKNNVGWFVVREKYLKRTDYKPDEQCQSKHDTPRPKLHVVLSFLRLCLVTHVMQNANHFGMMKCKMPKFS
jgi:hypothetical protein